jgi:hypothetical protein
LMTEREWTLFSCHAKQGGVKHIDAIGRLKTGV